mgnify:CR=1 FL=1|tara:strand:- start:6742 stop:7479 length:738 start_codon:yes stop_codon:yes gene_type:complete
MTITCGILFNCKQKFDPYVDWLLENQDVYGYTVYGIHASTDYTIQQFIRYNDSFKTFDEVVENSDIILSLGYWNIIDSSTIKKIPMGIINFHHSYKLKYKGRHCATWAIKNKESVHGSTMHFIDEKLDCGKIIDTNYFKIQDYHTSQDLFTRATDVGFNLLKDNFPKIIGKEHIEYKSHSEKSFYNKEVDLNHKIDVSTLQDTDELYRHIRSLTFAGCPSPYVVIGGKKVYLKLEGYDTGVLHAK